VVQLKEFVGGNIVGSGSNYVVVQKDRKRFLIELKDFTVVELKKFTTPYASDFWIQKSTFFISQYYKIISSLIYIWKWLYTS